MSNFLELNKQDYIKIGKGALIAVIGALMTYLSETIANIDFGEFTPLVMAGWSIIVNTLNKYLTNSKGKFGRKE